MITSVGFRVTANPGEDCYIPSFSFISACYATTKCVKWQNEIVHSSFKLIFDKQIIIFKDTFPPGTDLFQKAGFSKEVAVKKGYSECKSILYEIKFGSALLSQTKFEQGIYKATFTCSTNDNRIFTKNRDFIFRF